MGGSTLKKPDTYKLFNRLPSSLKKCLEHSFGTGLNERIWANRGLSSGTDYLGAEKDEHRKFLMKHISLFSPINNILEVGCGTGLNLYLLSKEFPHAEIIGIDINNNSVQYGNAYFRNKKISNVELMIGKADNLQQFQDKGFDVVFTDATLMYIGPDKIKKVLKELLRISSRGVVFLEWNWFENTSYPDDVYIDHWVRSYEKLLNKLFSGRSVQINKLPSGMFNGDENWGRYGAVIKIGAV